MNAARIALSRAVNSAIAKGAPVFVNRNSFQQWARDYATPRGFAVSDRGNWVALTKAGDTMECMSVDGVKRVCSRIAS